MGDARPPLGVFLDTFGVDATLTLVGGAGGAIPVRVIWEEEAEQSGADMSLGASAGTVINAHEVVSMPKATVGGVAPHGALLMAPRSEGEVPRAWRVTRVDDLDPELYRVQVVSR